MIAGLLGVLGAGCVVHAAPPPPGPPAPQPPPAVTAAGDTGGPPGATTGGACSAEEMASEGSFDVLTNERFGPLRIGLSAVDARAALGEPSAVDGPYPNEVEGGLSWTWTYPDRGVTLSLVGPTDDNPRVDAITLGEGCSLTSRFGIGIGSPVADVERAYGTCLSPDDSSDGMLVAGSVYGGVMFSIEDGVVRSIFAGAAAE
jgi:hypothetical protein